MGSLAASLAEFFDNGVFAMRRDHLKQDKSVTLVCSIGIARSGVED